MVFLHDYMHDFWLLRLLVINYQSIICEILTCYYFRYKVRHCMALLLQYTYGLYEIITIESYK